MSGSPVNPPDTGAKAYSALEMEAALCVWEEITERLGHCRTGYIGPHPDDPQALAIDAFWSGVGAAHMRSLAVPRGAWCLRVYEAMTPDEVDGFAYDWDLIPACLRHVVWHGDDGRNPTLPDPVTTARKVAEAFARRAAA